MKFRAITYKQNSQEYLATVLPFDTVYKFSKVLVYDVDKGGYQRLPQPLHYKKISKYILENKADFKLPTSIILGVDRSFADEIFDKNSNTINLQQIKNPIFRIVDGQHRIFGIAEARKKLPELEDLLLNVIIVISEKNHRSVELEIFKDINSKAKRINVDLATLATRDYEVLENRIDKSELSSHIAWKVAYHLKTNHKSVWSNGIKFDIHSDIKLGIIGISAFIDSIKGIIDVLIKDKNLDNFDGLELIQKCETSAKETSKLFEDIWDDIVLKKWDPCFKSSLVYNDEDILVNIYYDRNKYIQKPIGVKSIHRMFLEILRENRGQIQKSFTLFRDLIEKSKVKSSDWDSGGPFSGFNSEGGFKKIGMMMKNEINVPRNLD